MAKKKAKLPQKRARKVLPKASKLERMAAEIARLRKKLARYDRQRSSKASAKTVARRRVSQTRIDEKRTSAKHFLEQVKRGAEGEGLAISYRTHVNSNQSIDAEIRLVLEDSGDVKDNLIRLEDAANWNGLGDDWWIMMGVNAGDPQITNSPTIDKRPHRAWTNPVRGSRAGAAFFAMREIVVDNLEAYFGSQGEFTLIVVRLHWSPSGDKPGRPRK